MNAAANGHLDIVKYLCGTCCVNIETRNNEGNTPIDIASKNGFLEIVVYLLEQCHAKVTKETNKQAKTEDIRKYLSPRKSMIPRPQSWAPKKSKKIIRNK